MTRSIEGRWLLTFLQLLDQIWAFILQSLGFSAMAARWPSQLQDSCPWQEAGWWWHQMAYSFHQENKNFPWGSQEISVCVSLARTVIWAPLTARKTEKVTISFFWPLLVEFDESGGVGDKCSVSHLPTELVTAYCEWYPMFPCSEVSCMKCHGRVHAQIFYMFILAPLSVYFKLIELS